MTTILFAFIIAFLLSLVLTPGAKWLGVRFGAVDIPSARKVHTRAIPRIGGLAIAVSFFLAIAACTFLMSDISNLLSWSRPRIFGILGGVVIFAVGFFDDFHRLGPRIKFLAQIIAATLAYYGGLRIETFVAGGMGFQFGILSYVVTVFWFLLLINAMNLIDGLDGLAAGVAFFTSAVMVILGIMQTNYLAALEFAALGGALLGFLRYNFNPASIFMGDGGSYFIGYTIAALSILGSFKSGVGATLLIPLLALGVPIFDTLLAPVRRWIRGRQMFHPDKGHIHHQLVAMGLSSKRVVLIIYGVSFMLCVASILLVNLRNEMAGLLLIILGVGVFIIVRKLGYLEYLAVDKLFGWFKDLSDEAGLTRNRRSFLSLQIEMDHVKNIEELWEDICRALEVMKFDRGELHIYNSADADLSEPGSAKAQAIDRLERRKKSAQGYSTENEVWVARKNSRGESVRVWARGHHRRQEDVQNDGLLYIEIPLEDGSPRSARLILVKNLTKEPIQPYTLRRVEYLRRSVKNAMKQLKIEEIGEEK
jgi:UDP-GlcNAc:undecaprenyl-phosphate GlcNAc-1-phosphate transferase